MLRRKDGVLYLLRVAWLVLARLYKLSRNVECVKSECRPETCPELYTPAETNITCVYMGTRRMDTVQLRVESGLAVETSVGNLNRTRPELGEKRTTDCTELKTVRERYVEVNEKKLHVK